MKLNILLVKQQGPMLLVLLIISAVSNLALTDKNDWDDPTLVGSNMGLRILKRDNLQLNRILKAHGNTIKVFKRGKYHGIKDLFQRYKFQETSWPKKIFQPNPRYCFDLSGYLNSGQSVG